ncbi:hypothetical protein WT12_28910 [Burkholderia territorii]|uniref:hypothetical protein n=1 Tax=Burkholderia territorii TaxID=1503055 RepID=UPI00075C07F5|nr:hypothetical protein [Burkholderia territorii]KVN40325.1 hypothetical protein WT12_28910 [Burkholderia territorii]
MKMLFKYALLLVLSLLYFVVVVPAGVGLRLVSDKLRLRRDERASTYFQMFPSVGIGEACAQQGTVKQFTTSNS